VSGEAILSAENSENLRGGRGSAPNPARGAHRAHPDPIAGGEGLLPLPKNSTPALGIRVFGLGPQ